MARERALLNCHDYLCNDILHHVLNPGHHPTVHTILTALSQPTSPFSTFFNNILHNLSHLASIKLKSPRKA